MGKTRRCAAAVAVVLATFCGLLVPAPGALAATGCSTGIRERDFTTLTVSATCAPPPEQSAPYVFRIGLLVGWKLVGLGVTLYPIGPATATCAAYGPWNDNAAIRATGCTFVRD